MSLWLGSDLWRHREAVIAPSEGSCVGLAALWEPVPREGHLLGLPRYELQALSLSQGEIKQTHHLKRLSGWASISEADMHEWESHSASPVEAPAAPNDRTKKMRHASSRVAKHHLARSLCPGALCGSHGVARRSESSRTDYPGRKWRLGAAGKQDNESRGVSVRETRPRVAGRGIPLRGSCAARESGPPGRT